MHGLFLFVNIDHQYTLCYRYDWIYSWRNLHFSFTLRKSVSFLFFTDTHTLSHTQSYAHNESMFACLYVREKDVLPLSPCLNEPWHPALTAALRPSGLKLEQLTGADGPARSHAPLGLERKYHYHINHGCTHMDHSLITKINMAVCLCMTEMASFLILYRLYIIQSFPLFAQTINAFLNKRH